MAINLTPRLRAIVELVPPGGTVADIGTDHGYVPTYLIVNGLASKAIASDINEAPLEAARDTVAQFKLANSIETRHGGGLSVLRKHEVDNIVVAGMGGSTISCIVEGELAIAQSAKRLIIQPMNNIAETRKRISKLGFTIVDELAAQEGHHIYHIIAFEPGTPLDMNRMELEYGPILLAKRDPIIHRLLQLDKEKIEQILMQMKAASCDLADKKVAFIARYQRIDEVLQSWRL